MSEHNQSSKFTDESAAIAQETVEKGKAAEQSTRAAVENILDYNLKIMDMARVNTEAVFELAHELATAKAASDMVEIWTAQARKAIRDAEQSDQGTRSARTEDRRRERRGRSPAAISKFAW